MFETPTEDKSDIPHEVMLAGIFLVSIPVGGALFSWLTSLWNGDFEWVGRLFGGVTFYALSIGFSLSAIRHPVGRWGRLLGWMMLGLNAGFALLAIPSGSP